MSHIFISYTAFLDAIYVDDFKKKTYKTALIAIINIILISWNNFPLSLFQQETFESNLIVMCISHTLILLGCVNNLYLLLVSINSVWIFGNYDPIFVCIKLYFSIPVKPGYTYKLIYSNAPLSTILSYHCR